MFQENEFWKVIQGILLLIGMHVLGLLFIYTLGYILQQFFGGYILLTVWFIGFAGFFLWQLLYVIPVCIWLKRKSKIFMMKGIIIGAVITALVNGSCFLLIGR